MENVLRDRFKKETNDVNQASSFIEAGFNYGSGFDSQEEAVLAIQRQGEDYTHYTILPYIYMTI